MTADSQGGERERAGRPEGVGLGLTGILVKEHIPMLGSPHRDLGAQMDMNPASGRSLETKQRDQSL